MYFSEIYSKWHLSTLDLYLEKVYIYLSYTCAPRIRLFYCYMIVVLVHIFCTEFPKHTTVKKKRKQQMLPHNTIIRHKTTLKLCNVMERKCHQWRGNNDCQALGCWSTPSTICLSFWIEFIIFFRFLFKMLFISEFLYLWNLPTFKCFKKNVWS